MSQRFVFSCAGLLVALLLTTFTFGQSTFGSFTGTVKDPSGALIPGAEVEVLNQGTGAVRKIITSSAGVFNAANLDLGNYRVRVSAKGFNSYDHADLVLTANRVINLDVTLTLGATSDIV